MHHLLGTQVDVLGISNVELLSQYIYQLSSDGLASEVRLYFNNV